MPGKGCNGVGVGARRLVNPDHQPLLAFRSNDMRVIASWHNHDTLLQSMILQHYFLKLLNYHLDNHNAM